jgi:type IV pilus assembly protein PilW
MGIFQINATASTTNLSHATGTAVPGNAVNGLWQLSTGIPRTYYNAAGSINAGATAPTGTGFTQDSSVMALHSEAYFVGNSESDATVPALFRDRMQVNTTTNTAYTVEEELVQGVENMQVLYGMDTNGDGLADQYVKASGVTGIGSLIWRNVVSVRVTMRLRSIAPVYVNNETYAAFDDGAGNAIAGTGGSDRYMRQIISTTIMLRNFHQ